MKNEINQCLFGYTDRKGHHKIASSQGSLTHESEQTLLRMSDRSGSFCAGFNEYVTLYYLENDDLYAFAKTWRAKEIRRPGCVWTHTVLFDKTVKNDINNLYDLTTLFQKPSLPISVKAYSEPKFLSTKSINQTNNEYPIDLEENICACLAMNDSLPILLVDDNSKDLEQLIFNIWSDRKDFSFCTGSLAIRKLNKKPLELQVTPKKLKKYKKIDAHIIDEKGEIISKKLDDIELYKFVKREQENKKFLEKLVEYIRKTFTSNNFTKIFNKAISYSPKVKEIDLFHNYSKYSKFFDPNELNLKKRSKKIFQKELIKEEEKKQFLFESYRFRKDNKIHSIMFNGFSEAIIEQEFQTKDIKLVKEFKNFLNKNTSDSKNYQQFYKDVQHFIESKKEYLSGSNQASDSGLGSGSNQASDSGLGLDSGSNQASDSDSGLGSNQASDSGSGSGSNSNQASDSGLDLGSNSNQASDSGLGLGSNSNQASDSGLSLGSGSDQASDSGLSLGSGSDSGSGSGSGSNPDPGFEYIMAAKIINDKNNYSINDIIDFLNSIDFYNQQVIDIISNQKDEKDIISNNKWSNMAIIINEENFKQKNDYMLMFLSVGFIKSSWEIISKSFQTVYIGLKKKNVPHKWNEFKKIYCVNELYFKEKRTSNKWDVLANVPWKPEIQDYLIAALVEKCCQEELNKKYYSSEKLNIYRKKKLNKKGFSSEYIDSSILKDAKAKYRNYTNKTKYNFLYYL